MYTAPLSVKEELMKQMLRMDYEPEQVVDIGTLSREQWLAFRRLVSIPWLQSHSIRYREPSIPNDRAT